MILSNKIFFNKEFNGAELNKCESSAANIHSSSASFFFNAPDRAKVTTTLLIFYFFFS